MRGTGESKEPGENPALSPERRGIALSIALKNVKCWCMQRGAGISQEPMLI